MPHIMEAINLGRLSPDPLLCGSIVEEEWFPPLMMGLPLILYVVATNTKIHMFPILAGLVLTTICYALMFLSVLDAQTPCRDFIHGYEAFDFYLTSLMTLLSFWSAFIMLLEIIYSYIRSLLFPQRKQSGTRDPNSAQAMAKNPEQTHRTSKTATQDEIKSLEMAKSSRARQRMAFFTLGQEVERLKQKHVRVPNWQVEHYLTTLDEEILAMDVGEQLSMKLKDWEIFYRNDYWN